MMKANVTLIKQLLDRSKEQRELSMENSFSKLAKAENEIETLLAQNATVGLKALKRGRMMNIEITR